MIDEIGFFYVSKAFSSWIEMYNACEISLILCWFNRQLVEQLFENDNFLLYSCYIHVVINFFFFWLRHHILCFLSFGQYWMLLSFTKRKSLSKFTPKGWWLQVFITGNKKKKKKKRKYFHSLHVACFFVAMFR